MANSTIEDDSRMHNITMETNVIQIDVENVLHSSVGSQETANISENERNGLVEQPKFVLNGKNWPANGVTIL